MISAFKIMPFRNLAILLMVATIFNGCIRVNQKESTVWESRVAVKIRIQEKLLSAFGTVQINSGRLTFNLTDGMGINRYIMIISEDETQLFRSDLNCTMKTGYWLMKFKKVLGIKIRFNDVLRLMMEPVQSGRAKGINCPGKQDYVLAIIKEGSSTDNHGVIRVNLSKVGFKLMVKFLEEPEYLPFASLADDIGCAGTCEMDDFYEWMSVK